MNPRNTLHRVLQTKVDAQCDKLVTTLSWQRLLWSTFWVIVSYLSKVANFKLPHLHLVPPLGVIPFQCCWDLQHQKIRVPGQSCCTVYMILRLGVSSVEHWLVTERQIDRQIHDYGIYHASMASSSKNCVWHFDNTCKGPLFSGAFVKASSVCSYKWL